MAEVTTIQLDKKIVEKLRKVKEYPRQTYNDLLEKLVNVFTTAKKHNTYDEFLHKIQQSKMKELWDSKEDEVWESV
jgi:hypothetical protein|tara:strand:- start:280 stop:507 length:228 start_codon:yes stop_codon:yes gene_type:complete